MSGGESSGKSSRTILSVNGRSVHPLARPAFWCYAAALFVATHWPKLTVPGAEIRSDLLVHAAVFGGWTFLLGVCGFFGAWRARRSIAIAVGIGILYASFDEGLQAIPALKRVCAWDDFGADCLGVVMGGAALVVLARVLARRARSA